MTLSFAYKGFNYTSYYNGAYVDANSLPALAATGANSVSLNIQYGINISNSTAYVDGDYTDNLARLGNIIDQAVGLGLSVMVKPLIDFLQPPLIGPNGVGDWRAYFNPTNPAAFFASYKTLIVAEAQVAETHGAKLLSIGTELDQLTGPAYLSSWTDIINSIHAVFSGALTYSSIWDDGISPWQGHNGLPAGTGSLATQVSFWNQLDYLGVDVYPAISDAAHPTMDQLLAGWTQVPTDPETHSVTGNQSLISYFAGLAAQIGKPMLFAEIGYESASDAALEPAGTSTNVFDPALQANLYSAFFEAWKTSGYNSALKGVWFWNWDPNAAEVGPTNGANFSPQGLPAEDVVKANFKSMLPNDFNGDNFGDILVQNPITGQIAYGAMAGGTFQSWVKLSTTPGFAVVGNGRIAADASLDVVIQNAGGKIDYANLVNGSFSSWMSVANAPGWAVAAVGDINRDSFADIVIQNQSSGQIAYANMLNGAFQRWVNVGTTPGWNAKGAADINGDSFADIVIQNQSSGQIAYGNMVNGVLQSWVNVGTTPGWGVSGVGDVNGDGFADVVIQNQSSGQIAYGNMVNGALQNWVNVATTPGYNVSAVEDVNGDGFQDVVLQAAGPSGQLLYANMAGGTFQYWVGIPAAPGWTAHTAPEADTGSVPAAVSMLDPGLQADSVPTAVHMFDPGPQQEVVGAVSMLDPGPQPDGAPTPIHMFDPGPASEAQTANAPSPVHMFDPGPAGGMQASDVPAHVQMFDPGPQVGSSLRPFEIIPNDHRV